MTSLASLDYSYVSQFFSNLVAYGMTEKGNIAEQLKASSYASEFPTNVLENCLHKFQTETDFCDEDEEDCQAKSCPTQDDLEDQLNAIITNKWATGQIYGDMIANMFGATLDAPA